MAEGKVLSRRIRRLIGGVGISIIALMVTSFGAVPVAHAADGDWYEVKVLKVLSKTYMVDYNKKLEPRCNLPCSISTTTSVTRTVGLAFGLTRSVVTAKLGISNATTASITVSCKAPKQSGRSYLVAYAEGYRYNYRVQRKTYDYYGTLKNTEEMTLVAFDPKGVHCVAE